MISLDAWSKVTDPRAIWLMRMRYYYDLQKSQSLAKLIDESIYRVSQFHQVSTECVDVILNSPNNWMKKVGDHAEGRMILDFSLKHVHSTQLTQSSVIHEPLYVCRTRFKELRLCCAVCNWQVCVVVCSKTCDWFAIGGVPACPVIMEKACVSQIR